MKIRTKLLALLTMIISLFLAGCLNSNENKDSAKGVKVLRDRNSVTVIAEGNFAGAVITVDGINSSTNVKFENGNIGIVSNKNGESTISVIKPNGEVKADEILFRVNNVEEKVSVKLADEITAEDADKEIAKSAKKIARAAGDILVGDFDGNGIVGLEDFTAFSTAYTAAYNAKYDIYPAAKASADSNWVNIYSKSTPDGAINILDFVIFGRNYGKTNPDVSVTTVAITGGTTVEVGKTLALGVTVTYSNGQTDTSGAGVTWSSSDTAKATVSAGTVNGLAAGTTTITATKEGKSGTLSLTVKAVDTALKLYYKGTAAPTIWFWEDGGRAICILEGLTWETQPTMTASTDAPGWYEYTIPAKYLPLTKRLGVIFNKGSNTYTAAAPTVSQWYDGTWHDANPDGPKAPTITLSGAGTYVAGTYNVTVNVAGDSITTIKYTKDGTAPSATNGTTVTNGGTIPVTLTAGATVTVKVYAENSVGSSTAEAVLKEGQPVKAGFSWDNATVYFVMTDRFYNGDTSNDHSYGRRNDYGSDVLNSGAFLGGDIKGMTTKLEEGYFTDLGVNAIWVTAPYEQSHGWTGGGPQNDFPHYAYHGYYPLDWTMMDKNMGTVEEFRKFVDTAHAKGIRVILDIVMNHVGYHTLADASEYGYAGVTMTLADAYKHYPGWDYHSNFKYTVRSEWDKWWSEGWLRAGTNGSIYGNGGQSGDLKINTSDLPDVKTEVTTDAGLAPILKTKWARETTGYDNWIVPAAKDLRKDLGISPSDYQVKWLAAWVKEFGIDGFRCDTAKHVDLFRWKQLKTAANTALQEWRAANPSKAGANWTENFWMTGEVYDMGYGYQSDYATNGFDSLINFTFPKDGSLTSIGSTWKTYADTLNTRDDWNTLSYLSSHDKGLFGIGNKVNCGTTLLLSPGAVQIYYGDENDRGWGPGKSTSDSMQGSRGLYQWGANPTVLAHWQKLGKFRNSHISVGAGTQIDLGSNTYGRTYNKNGVTDKVVINVGGSGSVSVNVSGVFADGTSVRNAYDGATGTVASGKVTFTAANGVILIEENK